MNDYLLQYCIVRLKVQLGVYIKLESKCVSHPLYSKIQSRSRQVYTVPWINHSWKKGFHVQGHLCNFYEELHIEI